MVKKNLYPINNKSVTHSMVQPVSNNQEIKVQGSVVSVWEVISKFKKPESAVQRDELSLMAHT